MTSFCGVVTLVGETNVGKSSLLNAFAKSALAEVHRKRNLTREPMRAVITKDERQLVVEDTAGLNRQAQKESSAKRREQPLAASRHVDLTLADLALWVVDAARGEKAVDAILESVEEQGMQESSSRLFVALNKVDLLKDKRRLLPLAEKLGASGRFREVFMLSAKRGDGIESARETLMLALPEASFLYEREGDTREPSLVACETTRTLLFERLHDELPYEAVVACEQCEQKEDGWHIAQKILFRRESQRQILLAREARLLHTLRARAERALQKRFASPVSLQIHLPRPRAR